MQTIFQKFEEIALKYPNNIALGYKKEGHYKTIKYGRLLVLVNRAVAGLKKLGVKKGDRVAIFSRNRPEWVKMDLALNKIGAIGVPIHTTLSPKLIAYIINNSQAKYLAIGDLFSKFQEIEKEVSLEKIISFPEIEWRPDIVYFEDLLKEEPDNEPTIVVDDCAIVYTSGTTGEPKGVVLTNQNFLTNIESATKYVPYFASDVFLSFLPLSHVLERTGGYYGPLVHGAAIYFAESPKTIAEDVKKVRPTILVSVPRIFERIYDKIMDRVRLRSKLQQKLFFKAIDISRKFITKRKNHSKLKPFFIISYFILDKLVLKKVRAKLGGRLRFALSGGASLNASIARFFESVGIKVLEGYGLTETSPIIAVNPINDYKFSCVGKVLDNLDVKIAPDKEVLVKGPSVFKGYYNQLAVSDEVFDENGYFKTGDLGFLDSNSYLTIIGRKKEMIITSTGKNINPVDLENALQESKYIAQAMVYGDNSKYLQALIVPDFEELKLFATLNKFEDEIFNLIKNQTVLDLYKKEIDEQLKNFADYEKIGEFKLLDREFSEEKEELTPTLKLRRKKIMKNFIT